ncbi:MAG: hypothetical protein R2860_08760 [Desulfobacterales bacterium]
MHRNVLKAKVDGAGGWTDFTEGPAVFMPAGSQDAIVAQGQKVGIEATAPM